MRAETRTDRAPRWYLRWGTFLRLEAAASAVLGTIGLVGWGLSGGGYFWPAWQWFALSVPLALQAAVRRGLLEEAGHRVLAVHGWVSGVLALGLLIIWALAGAGPFWPAWPCLVLGLLLCCHMAVRARVRGGRERELADRIDVLTRTRSSAVDVQAAELRRIERDLHDGTQARLVSVAMSLGLAEELLGCDPEALADLLAEARTSTLSALEDLRTVMKGIRQVQRGDRRQAGRHGKGRRQAHQQHLHEARPATGRGRQPPRARRPALPPAKLNLQGDRACRELSHERGVLRGGARGDDCPVTDVRAPRSAALTCKGWPQEAAMRMLMNNLDPEVAEHPDQLVVYGGSGRAARSWGAYHAIVEALRQLNHDETLLVQSGKPVGVLRTHEWAPRVLIANANLVPQWATWEEFRRLEQLGLTMYGQMTAGSWIYIGTQGILQGTYETFAAVAAKRFGGTLAGTITLTAGLGGMGGAQPLAVTMNGGVAICVECDPSRVARRIEQGYLDEVADDVDDAVRKAVRARDDRRPRSFGIIGNAAEVLPHLLATSAPVDVVTDQTSAHDPLTYLPRGVALEDMAALRAEDASGFTRRARESMAAHVAAMVGFLDRGAEVFDYGNSIRGEARLAGYERAFAFPGFVPAYIRPMFCEGKGPFRWAALSGSPEDIAATDRAVAELFPDNEPLNRWLKLAGERVKFQGLPARICWLGYGERHLAGLRFNELVARGDLAAPLAIGRDHLDTGSVASPYRETEGMADGSDAIADWPLLNALVNTASGASWVSIHHGGGVGIGRSIHAGQVCVADGSGLAAQKLERVLTNDPGTGVIRHADAGYPEARRIADANSLGVDFAPEQ